MLIVHPFTVEDKYDTQAATWHFFREHSAEIERKGWSVLHLLCDDDQDREMSRYEEGLKAVWGKDDLLIIEQDIVPSMPGISRMAACKQPLCTNDYGFQGETLCSPAMVHYKGHPVWTCLAHPHGPSTVLSMHRRWIDKDAGTSMQLRIGKERWADLAGLGYTRISQRAARDAGTGWIAGGWGTLDSRISDYLSQLHYRWHVHQPPAKHNHVDPHRKLEFRSSPKAPFVERAELEANGLADLLQGIEAAAGPRRGGLAAFRKAEKRLRRSPPIEDPLPPY